MMARAHRPLTSRPNTRLQPFRFPTIEHQLRQTCLTEESIHELLGGNSRVSEPQAFLLARRNHMKTSTSRSETILAGIARTSSHGAAFQYSGDLVVTPPISNTVMAIHKGRRPKMYLNFALLSPLLSERAPVSNTTRSPIGGAIKVNSNAPTHERCFLCAMNAASRGRHIHTAMKVVSIAT